MFWLTRINVKLQAHGGVCSSNCRFSKDTAEGMRVFVLFEGNRHLLDVEVGQTVSDIKSILREKFDLDTAQNEDGNNDILMVIRYAGSNLEDEWVFSDISIPHGATLRCELRENVKPYLEVFCSYSGDKIRFTDEFDVWDTKVSDLKSMITEKTGLHVSVFRLVTSEGKEMYDCHSLKKYKVDIGDTIGLETWNGWGEFLTAATKGQLTPTIKHMVSMYDDPLVARYQLRVALFIAAHFDYPQLALQLIKSGARCDEPVGAHPVREWCNREAHTDHFKTPIHEASQHGSLRCLQKFLHHSYACILAKDGSGLTPSNIARRYRQTECFKLLIAEQFRTRSTAGLTLGVYWRVRRWCERARDRALVFHKHSPNPLLLAMESRSYGNAVVGQKVQLDGFGDNMQTGTSKLQLSMTLKGVKHKPQAAVSNNRAFKLTRDDKYYPGSFQYHSSSGSSEEGETVSNSFSNEPAENLKRGNLNCEKCSLSSAVSKACFHGEKCTPETCNKHRSQICKPNSSDKEHGAKRNQFKVYRWKKAFEKGEKEAICSCSVKRKNSKKRSIGSPVNQSSRREGMPGILTNNSLVCVNNGNTNTQIQIFSSSDESAVGNRDFFVTQALVDNLEFKRNGEGRSMVKKSINQTEKLDTMPPLGSHSLVGDDILSLANLRLDDSVFSSKSDGNLGGGHRRTRSLGAATKRHHSTDHHRRATSEDLSPLSTQIYNRIMGQDMREAAKDSLNVAMTFRKKRWLQQVNMAIDLNSNTFKRQLHKYRAKQRASYAS